MQRCELCERDVSGTTRHHLIPRMRHRQPRVQRATTRAERHATVALCGPCHRQIHAVLSEKQLASDYNTVAALRGHPDIARFVAWLAGKPPDFRVRTQTQRRRR